MSERDHDRAGRGTPGRFAPGIRLKLIGFILPLLFITILAVAAAVTRITEGAIRWYLLQRGVAISRVVALSAGYSLMSGDRLALDILASETREGSKDLEFVAIRDKSGTVVSHSRLEESGTSYKPPTRAVPAGRFGETRVEEVARDGREMVEFTTPIRFTGKHVGFVSMALSKSSLLAAQHRIRRSIFMAAAFFLGVALVGTLLLASLVTTPVKKLSSGVGELANGATFHPIPAQSRDELGELTRNFNRMAETILAQQGRLSRYAKDLEEAYVSLVRVIAASIDARDPYTLGHSNRVARLACALGRRLGFSDEEVGHLERACLFHDVGKIRTPDDILLKAQSLNEGEETVMRSHPVDGAEILRAAPSLHRYIPVVLSHHEWYNGKGYPEGRHGSEIPVHSQIIALADAFDAMTSTRPYRKALTIREAIEEISRCRGTQFSPELTDAFVRLIENEPALYADGFKDMAL